MSPFRPMPASTRSACPTRSATPGTIRASSRTMTRPESRPGTDRPSTDTSTANGERYDANALDGGAPHSADAGQCARDQSGQRQVADRARERSRAVHQGPHHRSVGARRDTSRLQGAGHGARARDVCQPRGPAGRRSAAIRRRRPKSRPPFRPHRPTGSLRPTSIPCPGTAAAPAVQAVDLPPPTVPSADTAVATQPTGIVTTVPVPAATHLYVQAGAFSSYQNALRLQARLGAGLKISTHRPRTARRSIACDWDRLTISATPIRRWPGSPVLVVTTRESSSTSSGHSTGASVHDSSPYRRCRRLVCGARPCVGAGRQFRPPPITPSDGRGIRRGALAEGRLHTDAAGVDEQADDHGASVPAPQGRPRQAHDTFPVSERAWRERSGSEMFRQCRRPHDGRESDPWHHHRLGQ